MLTLHDQFEGSTKHANKGGVSNSEVIWLFHVGDVGDNTQRFFFNSVHVTIKIHYIEPCTAWKTRHDQGEGPKAQLRNIPKMTLSWLPN